MPAETFAFVAPFIRTESGMHCLPVPDEVVEGLRALHVRRLIGTLNGHPFTRTVMSDGQGLRFFLIARGFMRDLGIAVGDLVEVEIRPDPNPDHVELAEEFEIALAQDEEAAERFYAMTPGRRRGLNMYVTGAKRTETRIRRALELAHKIRTHTLYEDLQREEARRAKEADS